MKRKGLLKTLLLLCALVAGGGMAWAEDAYYTLDTTDSNNKTSNNSYASSGTVIVSGIGWSFNGNGTTQPWRLGGKSISDVDRVAYTTTAMGKAISSIDLTVGTASDITVNSLTLIVASNSDFTGVIDEVEEDFEASSTITFEPTSGDSWAKDSYYKFVFNVSVSSTTNKFVQFSKVEFFEAAATSYTITAVSNNDSWGTVSGTTTITATPEDGYRVIAGDGGYTVTSGTATVTNNGDNTFTVAPTSDCTIRINFEAIPTHTISWSVNGTVETEDVEEGEALDFSAPASGVPTGYTFMGWRTSTLDVTDTKPDDYVTSATSTADITYYAVMATSIIGTATWTLDYDNESGLSSSTGWGAYGTAYDYTASDGGTWTVKAYKNKGMQINTTKNASIKVPHCSGNIQSIAITCSAAKAVGFSTSDYTGSAITYLASGTDATSQTLDLSGESVTDGYIVPKSGNTSITKIVVTYIGGTYGGYCTTVPPVSVTVSKAGFATFVSDYDLDFTSATTKAYKVNVASPGVATLTLVNKVPAKTPVLLYAEGGNGAGEAIAITTDAVDAVTGNDLVAGTGAAVATNQTIAEVEYTNMILNNVGGNIGFYFAAGQEVAANRAYLHIASTLAPDAAARMTMVFADEATGISNVSSQMEDGRGYYDLQGRRVAQPTKGLYIVNGKKVIFK